MASRGAGNLGKLLVEVGADISALKKDLAKVNQSLGGVSKKNKQVTASLGDVWVKAAAKVFIFTQGLRTVQSVLSSLVGTAIQFESAFAGVRKTVDATEKEFAQISDGLRKMSVRLGESSSKLARVTEIAGQLGIRGSENLVKFTEVVQMLAETTNLSAEQASFQLARLIKLSGDSIQNIDRLGSAIVDLGNNFETTEAEILKMATRIAAAGNIAGLTSADILGISTAFTAAGVKAELGGTAIQRVLLELTQQGKKGRAEFVKFLTDIADAGDAGGEKLEELGFTSQRLKFAFLSVAASGGTLEEALNKSAEAYVSNTALTEEFAKRMNTTAKQLDRTKESFADLQIEMTMNLLPAISDTAKLFTELLIILTAIEKKTAAISGSAAGGFSGMGAALANTMAERFPGLFGAIGLGAGVGAGAGITQPGGGAAAGGAAVGAGGGGGAPGAPAPAAKDGLTKMQEAFKQMNKTMDLFVVKAKKITQQVGIFFQKLAGQILNDLGGAFAALIVDGKSLGESMIEMTKSIGRAVIAAVTKMIAITLAWIAVAVAAMFFNATPPDFKTFFTAALALSGGFRKGGAIMARDGLVTAQTGIATTGPMGEGGIPAVVHPNEIISPIDKFFDFFDNLQGNTFNIFPPEGDPREIAELVAFEVEKTKRNP